MTTLNKINLLFVLFSVYSIAQISITSTNFTYSQNFNSLEYLYGPHVWNDNSTLPGWYAVDPSKDTVKYTSSDGNSEGMGLRSFGTLLATDRAFGSSSVSEFFGMRFINSSGSTLVGLPIEFTGEQWRAVNESEQYLDFFYSLDADSLTDPDATWTVVNNLRFTSLINFLDPASGIDGNMPANNQTFSETINVSLLDGQNIWFKWQRNNIGPKWHGLGIDDFKFNPNGSTLPVELSSLTAISIGSSVKLNWSTETEVNNFGFEVERCVLSAERQAWNKIGFVPGNGNSNSQKDYSFIDENPSGGSGFQYRLKQIDNDGQFEYSKIVEVSFLKPVDFSLDQNYPNPFNPSTSIQYTIDSKQFVQLKVYDALGNEIATLVDEYKPAGIYNVQFTMNNLSSGIYFYQLKAGNFLETKKMVITK